MAEAGRRRRRPAPVGHPAGVAGRLSFRVLGPRPAAATVGGQMCFKARVVRAPWSRVRAAPALFLALGPLAAALSTGPGVARRRSQIDLGVDRADRIDTPTPPVIFGLPD